MISSNEINTLLGAGGNVVTADGKKIGSIGQIFADDRTGELERVTARTGLFGAGESFVPLAIATVVGNDLQVPYTKEQVKDAPHSEDRDGALSIEQEHALYAHYGLENDNAPSEPDQPEHVQGNTGAQAGTAIGDRSEGHDTSGPNTDESMTRSEEQLHVGTRQTEAGRARLRKYIVTEQETRTVPVSHDEVTITRKPITEANRDNALASGDLTEEEHEVILHEDKVVVDKDVVPVERIQLGTETVTDQQTVTENVRKEQVEFEDGSVDHTSTDHTSTDHTSTDHTSSDQATTDRTSDAPQ